jgi:hypothetical protein
MRDIPLIEPRQRFNVTVVDSENNQHAFVDAGFSVSAGGTLSVSTSDGKQARAWANGFWSNVAVVASDG